MSRPGKARPGGWARLAAWGVAGVFLWPLARRALLSLGGWGELLAQPGAFARAWAGSALVCLGCLAGQLLTGIPGAWGLAQYRFPGRRALLVCCALLVLVPAQAMLLPQYLLLQKLGLLDSLWALILPGAFSPLGTLLLWRGFSALPRELVETARDAGAGLFGLLGRVALPLCRRELAAFILISLADSYNQLEQPMAFIRDPELYPLSVWLSTGAYQNPALPAAQCLLSLLPLALAFWVLAGRGGCTRGAGPCYTEKKKRESKRRNGGFSHRDRPPGHHPPHPGG